MRPFFRLLAFLAAVALPVALIGLNVRLAFNSLPLYTYAVDAFDAPGRTGLPREDFIQAARTLIAFLNSDATTIAATAHLGGAEEPFFTPRETQHFADVRGLLRGVYAVRIVSLALIVAAIGLGLGSAYHGRREFLLAVLRSLRRGAYATIGGIAAIGLFAALGGFDWLFLQFHIVSFRNDLWQAMATDRMTQMFPEAFFFQATMLIGLVTIAQAALVILGITLGLRALQDRRERAPEQEPAPEHATKKS